MLDETCKLVFINLPCQQADINIRVVEKKINKFLDDNAQICVSVATQHNENYTEWVVTIVYIPKSPK